MKLFAELRSLDPLRPLAPWLLKVTANQAIDLVRARNRREGSESPDKGAPRQSGQPHADPDPPDPAPGPDSLAESSQLRKLVVELCSSLSSRQREVFVLRDLEEMPVAQIAACLDCAPSTVRVHLAEARRRLRELLLSRYPEYVGGE